MALEPYMPNTAMPSDDVLSNPFEEMKNDLKREMDDLLADFSDEELEELHLVEQRSDPVSGETLEAPIEAEPDYGRLEMQETFLAIMQQVLKPVTRYVKAVAVGVDCREIFEVINFSITPLIDKVEQVELFEHTSNLLSFKSCLTRILGSHFGSVSDEAVDELLDHYNQLRANFDLELRGNARAVNNILSFYRLMSFDEEVSVNEIRQFFAIGIPSITWIRRTSATEISSLSGIPFDRALRLRKLAEEYREVSRDQTDPDLFAEGFPASL